VNCLFVDFEVICVLGWGVCVCWGQGVCGCVLGEGECVCVCAGVCWGQGCVLAGGGAVTFGEHSSETMPLSIRWCLHN
jgi:hypothetical protein